jgi:hypothetical protein
MIYVNLQIVLELLDSHPCASEKVLRKLRKKLSRLKIEPFCRLDNAAKIFRVRDSIEALKIFSGVTRENWSILVPRYVRLTMQLSARVESH